MSDVTNAAAGQVFPAFVDKDDYGVTAMPYAQLFAPDLMSQLWIMLGAS